MLPNPLIAKLPPYDRGSLQIARMNTEPTVFIVDDDPAIADSLAVSASSMHLKTRLFPSPEEYLNQFDPQLPGCLILNVRMPKKSGLALQEKLAQLPLCPAIIVLTAYAEAPTALRAIRQEAVDFLPKTFSQSELCEAIRRAISRDAANRATFRRRDEVASRLAKLSDAEKQVLEQVLLGVPNKRIATLLEISRRTVEDRRARVMQKLEVDSLADLVRLAIEAGMRTE
jgi:two-component system response regulator FixJ